MPRETARLDVIGPSSAFPRVIYAPSVLKQNFSSIPRETIRHVSRDATDACSYAAFVRAVVRSRGDRCHVHRLRPTLAVRRDASFRRSGQCMRDGSPLRPRSTDVPLDDVLPASPWRSRRRVDAGENGLRRGRAEIRPAGFVSQGSCIRARGSAARAETAASLSSLVDVNTRSCLCSGRVRSPESTGRIYVRSRTVRQTY